MNNLHRKLNLPFSFKPPRQISGNSRLESRVDLSLIDPTLTEWLDSLGIYVSNCRYFYMPSWSEYPLHIDIGTSENNAARLNFVIGGEDSIMLWYKLQQGKSGKIFPNQVGEPVATFKETECEEIYRVKDLQGPNLLNVGTIHTVKNSKTDRHCYAFSLSTTKDNFRLQWDQAYELLTPFCQ